MDSTLNDIIKTLRRRKDSDFRHYRRDSVARAVADRMAALGCAGPAAYVARLTGDPTECDALLRACAINVSSFFRNPIVFEVLAEKLIPELLERKRTAKRQEIRILSAGCATGEEPYSMAMIVWQAFEQGDGKCATRIFATDINPDALDHARRGLYTEDQIGDAKHWVVKKFFVRKGRRFEVIPEIREMVLFSQDDLTASRLSAPPDSVFGAFDIVLCRNVLVYLKDGLQADVCKKFAHVLNPGGYLVLGEAETIPPELHATFRGIDYWSHIYRKRL